jgi:Ca-activated chloride channel family protein
MKKGVLILLMGLGSLSAQERQPEQEKSLEASRNITWEANQDLEKEQFVNAEAKYRKAISKSGENIAAPYNLGNAYYDNERYTEAFGRYKQAGESAKDKGNKHNAYHNMGNVFMKNKDYAKAVDAYKDALRNDPTDEETRYNLALAKEMLKKQQDEQEDQKDKENQDQKDQKEQNQDKQNEGDNEDKNKQEQNDQNKDQGDKGDQGDKEKEENKEGEGDEKKEQQKQPQQGDEDKQEAPPRPNQLSPQQIQNLLEAMQNEERKVQEKLDAQKVKGVPSKSKKDW